jgi:hypothetical protein
MTGTAWDHIWTAAPGKHFFGVANDLVGLAGPHRVIRV